MNENKAKRLGVMTLGLIAMSLGIALFRMPRLGNDPFTGMCFAIADRAGIGLGQLELYINLALFVIMLALLRHRVGIGTLINATLVGYVVEFLVNGMTALLGEPRVLWLRLLVMLAATAITSLGCSLYFTADMGISPYDATAFILDRYLPIPFAVCRIITDGTCVILCLLLGGIVNVGTLVAAVGMGPLISWCNRHISEKMLG